MNRIELVFQQRLVTPSELYRNIVEPAGRKAEIEMTESRYDNSGDRDFDVRPRLIEDEKIEAFTLGNPDSSQFLMGA